MRAARATPAPPGPILPRWDEVYDRVVFCPEVGCGHVDDLLDVCKHLRDAHHYDRAALMAWRDRVKGGQA